MRPRRSISGPLILIAIGVLFLFHTIRPDFHIMRIFAESWPYWLIVWGFVELIEIAVWAMRPATGPPAMYTGVGGGAWVLVLLLCFAGLSAFEIQRPGEWWHQFGFERGMEMFGNEHGYSIGPIQRTTGENPKIVIENFRGDAKITGGTGSSVLLTGHKIVRAMDDRAALAANNDTPVDVVTQGNTIVIRCNQDRTHSRTLITTDLDVTVPKGASVEINGREGDLDVEGINGDVDVSSEKASVRVARVKGNVHVDTRKSDDIHCSDIGGGVVLRGHGSDVSLENVAGEVNVNGDYSGVVALDAIAKAVRVEGSRTEFDAKSIPGEVKLARGSVDGNGLAGPVKMKTEATDVTLANFSDDLDLSVDRGDVDLRPGKGPLGKMTVHTGSGDIDLAVPQHGGFALTAITDRGDIDSDLGSGFEQHTEDHAVRLEGSNGTGPALSVSTGRGDISLHKDNGDHPTPPKSPKPPKPPVSDEMAAT